MESFTYVSLGLIALGLFFLARTIVFLRGAARTQGRVVSLEHHPGENGATYKPVVEYVRPDGQRQQFREQIASGNPRVKVGDTVPVRFDPERPEHARIDRPLSLWGLPAFFLLMGVTFLPASL